MTAADPDPRCLARAGVRAMLFSSVLPASERYRGGTGPSEQPHPAAESRSQGSGLFRVQAAQGGVNAAPSLIA